MIYVASPYTGTDEEKEWRYTAVCNFCEWRYWQFGEYVYSPIAHWHPINTRSGHQTKFELFERMDCHFISRCSGMYVLRLPDWQESIGVTLEVKHAKAMRLQIVFVDLIEEYLWKLDYTTENRNVA